MKQIYKLVSIFIILTLITNIAAAITLSTTTEIKTDFSKLTSDITTLPPGVVPGNSFMAKVNAAQAAFDKNNFCTAVNIFGALRNEIRASAGKGGFTSQMANHIDTDVISIIALLLASPDTAKCGGGTASSDKNAPETTIISSDTNGMQLHIVFPIPHFTPRIGNGVPFTDISMDGMGLLKDIGKPDIPVLTQLFTIPIGADVSVKQLGSTSYMIDNINLWPRQEEPVDDVFGDKPFKIDTAFYAINALYPTDPTKTGPLGTMRDLNIGGIETDGVQYNAVAKSLIVYTSMDLKITFGGDNTGKFADNRLTSIWNIPFQTIYKNSLLNFEVAQKNVISKIFNFCGSDDLIITSPRLRGSVNLLADARSNDGFWTEIVEVGTGKDSNGVDRIGTTPEDIQKYVQDKILGNVCINRPSYVTIVGDTVDVPTFHLDSPDFDVGFDGKIASDIPYVFPVGRNISFADAAIGRIPAGAINLTLSKIIGYEDNPPISPFGSFYSKATFTSYFEGTDPQDRRSFTKSSETIRNALVGLGYTVDRIYTDDGDIVNEQQYYDGTPIPAELKKPTFGWNGNTQGVIDHWNNGRFIVFHRDHGNPTGWAHPDFTVDNIPSLTNGDLLPVVFSINCASGKFDGPTPSFAEQVLEKTGGGAVGVIGDTRNSPTFTNSHLVVGLFDAIFPSVIPTYGSSSSITRMGDVLNTGKLYMDTQNGLDFQGAIETQAEQYLFHWLGDPTMQIWTSNPHNFFKKILTYQLVGNRLAIQLDQSGTDNAVLTLAQGGEVIGRAQLFQGQTSIELQKELNGEPLQLSLDKTSFIPLQVPIQVNTETTISGMKFNDINGDGIRDQDDFGLANWTIILTKPDGTTESNNTDSVGNYAFTNLPPGNYTVSEDIQSQVDWVQTLPGDRTPSFEYHVPLSVTDVTGLDFGNHQNIIR